MSPEVCKPNEKEGQAGCMRVLQVVGFFLGNCHSLFNMLNMNECKHDRMTLQVL